MESWTVVSIGSGNGLLADGTKQITKINIDSS